MFLLIIIFSVPEKKLNEFNSAMEHLVYWPVYMLHNSETKTGSKVFEIVRTWKSKDDMDKELAGHIYQNLLGIINVLGVIKKSKVYSVKEIA